MKMMMINIDKRSMTLNEINSIKTIRKNSQNTQLTIHMQKEVLPSCKLEDHAY